MDYEMKLHRFYNNVLGQAISTSGRFLFAGNRFGDIFVQNINDIESHDSERSKLKIFRQEGEEGEINCLCFHRDFLIVGSTAVIYGLKWDEEQQQLSTDRKWQIRIPIDVNAVEIPDVNFMYLNSETDTIYAACGDYNIYQISLEDGRIVRTYRGHVDYLHGVTCSPNGRLYSASEDGTVAVWSEYQESPIGVIEPGTRKELMRPEFGKWIGAVAANDDWIICGGGPKFSIWHTRSMDSTRDFPFPGKVHVCDFVEDRLLVAGEHTHVQFYDMNGELQANIPVENTATYSAVWQLEPVKFMSIGGFSNKLHILRDFRFLDSKIELYGNVEDKNQSMDEDNVWNTV